MPAPWQPIAVPGIDAGGAPLPDEVLGLLISATVEDSLHLPTAFTLTFRDPDRIVLDAAGLQMGSPVSISVISDAHPTGKALVEEAEVTALEIEVNAAGTLTVVRGYDRSHRLFRGTRTEVYRNATYSDIAGQVAGRAGLATGAVQATGTVHDHVWQAATTDWEFLTGLAREIGYEIRVRAGKLDFAPPASASQGPAEGNLQSTDPLQLTLYDDVLQLRCGVTGAQQVPEVSVRGWSAKDKAAVVGAAPARTVAAALDVAPADLASAFQGQTHVVADVPFETQTEAEAAAKAAAEEIAGSFASVEGLARGNAELRAGTAVSLGLLGKPFDGRYVLTATRHTFAEDGYTTWIEVSGRNERSLQGLASGRRGGGRRIAGVVPALVTDVQDPDDLCRVKVVFPWLSDSCETFWAPTVQVSAGNGYGTQILPEVGDEVLVAFEQGDMRRPYVVGGLYNGVDRPPSGAPALVDSSTGAVNRRTFVSRTGHRLSFDEKEGEKDGIILATSDGKHVVELSRKETTIRVMADGTVEIEAKGAPGAVAIKASGDMQLQGRRITLKGQTGVEIDGGGGKVDVKSGPGVNVQGAQVQITGSAIAEVKSAGILTIQGTLVQIN